MPVVARENKRRPPSVVYDVDLIQQLQVAVLAPLALLEARCIDKE